MAERIIIREARLSWPDLYTATQVNGTGPFNYRAVLLIPADSPQKKEIDEVIQRVAKDKWKDKAGIYLPEILIDKKACCWIDGNRRPYAGYAGNWALTALRKKEDGRPLVVDRSKNNLPEDSGKIYSGAWVNAIVEIYAQDNASGKGIRCGLNTIQWVRDGESFGGAAPASAEGLDDLGYSDEDDDLI